MYMSWFYIFFQKILRFTSTNYKRFLAQKTFKTQTFCLEELLKFLKAILKKKNYERIYNSVLDYNKSNKSFCKIFSVNHFIKEIRMQIIGHGA